MHQCKYGIRAEIGSPPTREMEVSNPSTSEEDMSEHTQKHRAEKITHMQTNRRNSLERVWIRNLNCFWGTEMREIN